jgi:antitoxin ParD1/3/4
MIANVRYVAPMVTRNVNLTETLDRFVEDTVASGDFQNASEVVREGLRLLKRQREEDDARLARLRAEIQVGMDQADRGETILVDDIDQWFDRLEAEIDAES